MELYKVVDDKTHNVLLETDSSETANVWDYAYEQIKSHPEYDVFIEVYTDEGFSHYVDSESIIYERENKK